MGAHDRSIAIRSRLKRILKINYNLVHQAFPRAVILAMAVVYASTFQQGATLFYSTTEVLFDRLENDGHF